jgi:hypothetical protein
VSDRLGHVQLQKLSKAHLDRLVTELLHLGRRVGNVQRQGLSPRSVNLMLTLLSGVLDDAVRQGTLTRNVAAMVERPSQTKKEMRTCTAGKAAIFLEAVTDHRLSSAFQLSGASPWRGARRILPLTTRHSRSKGPGWRSPERGSWRFHQRLNAASEPCHWTMPWCRLCARSEPTGTGATGSRDGVPSDLSSIAEASTSWSMSWAIYI